MTSATAATSSATPTATPYVSFEDEPGRRSAAHVMTREEARRVAVNVAKLADLLKLVIGVTRA
jgi:hypothetical protein